MILVIPAVALTLLVTVSAALLLATVVLAAAVLFVFTAAAPIAAVRPNAARQTDETAHQHKNSDAIGRFHELLLTVLGTWRPRHRARLTPEPAAVRTLQHAPARGVA